MKVHRRVEKRGNFILMLALGALANGGCAAVEPATQATNDCADCPEMVQIPIGRFEMGATIDRGYGEMDGPAHLVQIQRPFALARHEVTVGEFRKFVSETGYRSEGKCNVYDEGTTWHIDPARNWANPGFEQGEDHPVVCVSWQDAQAYIDWLNKKTGRSFRLPSEAEWEYVADAADIGGESRGGRVTHAVANMGKAECCGGKAEGADEWIRTAPVGSFPPDRFGLHDLRGNVWEWQQDCYNLNFNGAPVDGSARTSDCSSPEWRVVRGGSYGDAGEFFERRFRLRGPKDQAYFTLGFRLARSLP